MRILHCLRAPVGGLFRHVLDLAAEQARARPRGRHPRRQHAAQIALTEQQFAAIAPQLELGIDRIADEPSAGPWRLSPRRAPLRARARPLALDVLHGHGAKGGAYARLARRALRSEGQQVKALLHARTAAA